MDASAASFLSSAAAELHKDADALDAYGALAVAFAGAHSRAVTEFAARGVAGSGALPPISAHGFHPVPRSGTNAGLSFARRLNEAWSLLDGPRPANATNPEDDPYAVPAALAPAPDPIVALMRSRWPPQSDSASEGGDGKSEAASSDMSWASPLLAAVARAKREL
eukprot:CAMPEP_0118872500 /NCGR_PEP_ID=MMETSP1163-20130328/14669_1 /TAXON_ID=124430 /ORGANISM="Phaeomonas parva, Strain CCMP2877" /LENGTH=164 /DNA_ID=CAMNT_0006807691 /DNA_START=45 /DNA_END=536 /DNA_ORIENTATION=-